MELGLASVSCRACCLFPVTLKRSKATSFGCSSALLSSYKNSNSSRLRRLLSNFSSCPTLGVNQVRLQRLSLAAVLGDKTQVPDDCVGERVSGLDSSDSPTSNDEVDKDRENEDEKDRTEGSDYQNMIRICDKLMDVFFVDMPTPTDWRRLLAFSREWSNIRPHFFQYCQDLADAEADPELKHKLLRFARKLKEIDDDIQRHNELLEVIKAEQSEIREIVARRRKDFTKEFFEHLHNVVSSYYDNPTKQNALAKLWDTSLAAVQAYDNAAESIEKINAAELKFQDILNSPSLDTASRKIDSLAEKNQLDSASVLMMGKAWSASKESNLTKDEAKDILFHLYMTGRGNLQRLQPKDVRILKHLLTIEDPQELLYALNDAFTPGEEVEGEDVDQLYTTPETLHLVMRTVLDTFNLRPRSTLLRDAKDLMHPKVIEKLEELVKIVEKRFM